MTLQPPKPFARPFLGNAILKRRMGQGFDPSMFPGSQGYGAVGPVQQLAQNGAILKVQISNPTGGDAVDVQAMIDTGASITTMNNTIAQQAGLQQTGQTQLGGVGGVQMSSIYAARVVLPDYGVDMNPIQVATIPGGLPGVDMLIGRDMLMSLTMTYQGGQGAFSLVQDKSAPPPATGAQPGTPQYLPQPPASSGFPWLLVGGGTAAAALAAGALILFKVF